MTEMTIVPITIFDKLISASRVSEASIGHAGNLGHAGIHWAVLWHSIAPATGMLDAVGTFLSFGMDDAILGGRLKTVCS